MNKASSISKAIKEGKWLDIRYQQDNEVTVFWAAIKDVLIKEKRFAVTIFNDKKSLDVINTTISFDKIISAEVIAFSDYDVPEILIQKLEKNLDEETLQEFLNPYVEEIIKEMEQRDFKCDDVNADALAEEITERVEQQRYSQYNHLDRVYDKESVNLGCISHMLMNLLLYVGVILVIFLILSLLSFSSKSL